MRDRFELREFVVGDAPGVTRMLHRAYAELGEQGLRFAAIDQDEATTLERASGGSSWVLTDGGDIVATMTITYPPELSIQRMSREARVPGRTWLNQLAVDPGHRGEGLASRLWAVGRRWSRSVGASHVGLNTAIPAASLIELYEHWGFRRCETIQWPTKPYPSTVMLLAL
ncbi:GNAT family N-acetyltransferase [Actinocrispum sp. NPDC049592]|uniref:GNAT family N-acetyltransferase n=1 Tax=Actinocrispum sp. NPDC049592 TaxID=3154835 RepID=UPI00343C3A74